MCFLSSYPSLKTLGTCIKFLQLYGGGLRGRVLRVRVQVRGRRERPGRILISIAPLMDVTARMVSMSIVLSAACGRHSHPVVRLSEDGIVFGRSQLNITSIMI